MVVAGEPINSHALPLNPSAQVHSPLAMAHWPRLEQGKYSYTFVARTSANAQLRVPLDAVAEALEHTKSDNGGFPSWWCMLFCMGNTGHSVNSMVYTHPFVLVSGVDCVHVAVCTLPNACTNVMHDAPDSAVPSALNVVSKP